MYLLNPKVKPLSDVRVRRAIAHDIDRTAIIEHVLGGYGEKLDSLALKGYFGHTPGFSPGTNLPLFDNLDRQVDEARSEADPKRRLKLYHGTQKKLMEDFPAFPLFMGHHYLLSTPPCVRVP